MSVALRHYVRWMGALLSVALPAWEAYGQAEREPPAPPHSPLQPHPGESPDRSPREAMAVQEFPATQPYDITTTPMLTGDWGGARTWLQEHGLDLQFGLTSVYMHNARGGLDTHNGHRITGSADFFMTADLDKMGLWPGGSIYMQAESSWNQDLGFDKVGSLWGTDGDAFLGDEDIWVRELRFRQGFLDDKVEIWLGRMDPTFWFDTNTYANYEVTQFLNNALINTMNIPFPDFGLGAMVSVKPVDWFYVQAISVDAAADGRRTGFRSTFHGEDYFFSMLELGFQPKWKTPLGTLPGAYRFGMWYDPQPKPEIMDDQEGRRRIPLKRDDIGFYFNMDQLIFQEHPEDEEDLQGLGIFFRYGYAHEDVNEIEHFWSVGGQYLGLIPSRDNDVIGFGYARGEIGDALHQLDGSTAEEVYEFYYNAQVLPWLYVSPDVQYVVNPGAAGTRDAFVYGVRVFINF